MTVSDLGGFADRRENQRSPAGAPWTHELRDAALTLVQIGAAQYHGHRRALRYHLRSALAHGVTVDDICRASGLNVADVLALTDPATAD